jgi:hypothetical protein
MAAKKKAAKAGAAAWALKESPAVQRLLQDPELRGNLAQAYEATRDAYGRLSNGKAPHKAIFDDRKLQKDLKIASDSIRDASMALREGPQRKKRFGLGKLLIVTIVGAATAIALSEDLRKKVLDALFGAEEEFEYTSTTTPSSGGTPATSVPSGSSTAG